MNVNGRTKNIERCFLGTLLLYIATYCAVSRGGAMFADYATHTEWALSLNLRTFKDFLVNNASYPLWHIVTKTFYRFWGLCDYQAAATSTALFNCFAYWCVNFIWLNYENKHNYTSNTWYWSFFLFFMGPIYAPKYTFSYYMGQGTGNTWHNPTNIAVKGIAILCFALLCYLVNNMESHIESKIYIAVIILLVISALAKPSFLQGIIPGVGMFIVLKICGRNWYSKLKNYTKLILIFLPSVLVVIVQFGIAFVKGDDSTIGISYKYGLGQYTPNLLLSFIWAFAFPLTVLLIDFKVMVKDNMVQLAYCYEFCAWLESVVIYETGERLYHGNWLWGSYISMFIVWVVSLIKYWEFAGKNDRLVLKEKVAAILGMIIFFIQVLCGIAYWYQFMKGENIII